MRAGRKRPRARTLALSRGPSHSRLLLDTQAWLWWQTNDARLGGAARDAIMRAAEVYVSAASVWEIAIKSALGKLTLPRNADIAGELEADLFQGLSITVAHAERVRSLPAHHRDPFDRMLVAQALHEGLTILTTDASFARYDAPILSAID